MASPPSRPMNWWRETGAILWDGVKARVAPPPPPEIDPNPPPDMIEVPAFLRRCGPLLPPSSSRYDEMLDKHERLATANGVRIAAAAIYDITRSRWLAERLEALASRMQTDAEG